MDWMEPMEPVLTDHVVDESGFVHQIKWDGIRGITWIQDGKVRTFNKSGRERTGFYPEAEKIVHLLKTKEAVVDGELVVFDGMRPSFPLALKRDRVKSQKNLGLYTKQYPVRYILFDLLVFDGRDIRGAPLCERLGLLRSALTPNENIIVTDDFSDGHQLFDFMIQKSYEGIVSKNLSSTYVSGKKHKCWFKTKIRKFILAVVFGVHLKEGFPNSLILGVYDQGKPVYIGSAAVGLKDLDFRMIHQYAKQLKQEHNPFEELKLSSPVLWIKPVLTCRLSFMEWTNEGLLRHPQIVGFTNSPPKEAILGGEYV